MIGRLGRHPADSGEPVPGITGGMIGRTGPDYARCRRRILRRKARRQEHVVERAIDVIFRIVMRPAVKRVVNRA